MKANVEKIESNRVVLEVEVDEQELEKATQQAYKKLVKKYNIPGFRKGKVPRFVLEKYIGSDLLYGEAADIVLPNAYYDAVKETAIEPIDQPDVEIVQLESGKPFVFKAQVTVKPEVKLGEYKSLEAEKKILEIKDSQIEDYLKNLQERYARLINVEKGEIQKDDTVEIDYEGFIDGEAFPGGKGENYSLTIGSNTFIPGFEEQLIGLKAGEEQDIKVTFPEEYHAEELAGKEAVFKVSIKGIKRKELSPIDDEFAKDVSEFETLAELKADIRKNLEKTALDQADGEVRGQLVNKAAENSEIEIPEVLVDRRVEMIINDLRRNLEMQGLNLEQYLQFTAKTEDDLKQDYRDQAQKAVQSDLTLEAIAKAENIEVTEEDVDKEVQRIADLYQQDVKSVRAILASGENQENMKYSIMLDKAVDFLINDAKIIETTVKPEEVKANEAQQDSEIQNDETATEAVDTEK